MPILLMYKDEKVSVEVGVNMRDEEGVFIDDTHGYRDLSNSIKINADSPNARFIQFVTRIIPDMFEFKQFQKIQWNRELVKYSSHYMPSHDIPRWKIDTADDSCFYDSAGVHKRTANSTAMYDCPGGIYQAREERVIFCTFVIIDNKVTNKIQWSKQYNEEEEEFYTVNGQKCESLPGWAIKTITEDPLCTTKPEIHKVFELPEQLRSGYNKDLVRSESDLLSQAKEDLLSPPEDWYTKVNMPSLFLGLEQPALSSSLLKKIDQEWTSEANPTVITTSSTNPAENPLPSSSSHVQVDPNEAQLGKSSSSSSKLSTSTGSRPSSPK